MQVFSFTDKGPRTENQDFYCAEQLEAGLLAAVADGVGGNNGGQTAARFVVDLLRKEVQQRGCLKNFLEKAHTGLLEAAARSPDLHGMATTLTAVLCHSRAIEGIHCGDSRAYLLRGNGLKQLSTDHTEVAMLLSQGKISKEQALNYPRKNVLTSALGTQKELIVQSFTFNIERGDRLLLMTDGMHAVVNKREIQRESRATKNFGNFCKYIFDTVGARNPTDNFTLVGVEFDGIADAV